MMHDVVPFPYRFLPNQPSQRQFFEGEDSLLHERMYDLILKMSSDNFNDDQFSLEMPDDFPVEKMSSTSLQLAFMKFLINIKGCKRILEVGSFIGYSALHLASVLPDDGKLITIEKYDLFSEFAKKNIRNNKLENKISLIQGDAFEIIRSMKKEPFDLIFLDGNKEKYGEYFLLLDEFLEPGKGMLVVDDVFFGGDIFNDVCKTEKGEGTTNFLQIAKRSDSYHTFLLPMGDGVMLMQKK